MSPRQGQEGWIQHGPPEARDEAVHIRVVCRSCGTAFGEYQFAARPALLIAIGHETNELPSEPGWVRVGPRAAGVRGPLSGAVAYAIELLGSRTYLRWRCRGRYGRHCRASPKIEWAKLVRKVRRLARQSPNRPIEIAL